MFQVHTLSIVLLQYVLFKYNVVIVAGIELGVHLTQ